MNLANKLTMMRIILVPIFLSFPHQLAAIIIPSDAANVLNPETANSLAIITTTIQPDIKCISDKETNAAVTNNLSANGSINFPKLVIWFLLLAM